MRLQREERSTELQLKETSARRREKIWYSCAQEEGCGFALTNHKCFPFSEPRKTLALRSNERRSPEGPSCTQAKAGPTTRQPFLSLAERISTTATSRSVAALSAPIPQPRTQTPPRTTPSTRMPKRKNFRSAFKAKLPLSRNGAAASSALQSGFPWKRTSRDRRSAQRYFTTRHKLAPRCTLLLRLQNQPPENSPSALRSASADQRRRLTFALWEGSLTGILSRSAFQSPLNSVSNEFSHTSTYALMSEKRPVLSFRQTPPARSAEQRPAQQRRSRGPARASSKRNPQQEDLFRENLHFRSKKAAKFALFKASKAAPLPRRRLRPLANGKNAGGVSVTGESNSTATGRA